LGEIHFTDLRDGVHRVFGLLPAVTLTFEPKI